MKKSSRLIAAAAAVFSLLSLTGCAEVVSRAAVLDDENAAFIMEVSVSHDSMEKFAAMQASGALDAGEAIGSDGFGIPDLTGTWEQSGTTGDLPQELIITDDGLEIYKIGASGAKTLHWAGSYDSPDAPVISYDWVSSITPKALAELPVGTPQTRLFSLADSRIFYVDADSMGEPVAVFFSKPLSTEETPTAEAEVPAPVDSEGYTSEELCALMEDQALSRKGAENANVEISCTEDGMKLSMSYNVTYDYTGITSVNGEETTPEARRNLPFSFGVDAVYGDVLFQNSLLGLTDQKLIKTADEWSEVFTNYSLQISFPGEVTGFSEGGVQPTPETVLWEYDAIKTSVESGKYTLSAAGRADAKIDPVPIILSAVGVLFLLVLLVYFMWKRFSPKTIVITSYVLAILSPFGLALAIVAKRKARNNADWAGKATIAIWVTSAIFAFEALAVILFIVLAPQVVTELLSSIGLASSAGEGL